MITTLPGLYLFSVGVLKPLSFLLSLPIASICNAATLRLINASFAMFNLYIISEVSQTLNKTKQVDSIASIFIY